MKAKERRELEKTGTKQDTRDEEYQELKRTKEEAKKEEKKRRRIRHEREIL